MSKEALLQRQGEIQRELYVVNGQINRFQELRNQLSAIHVHLDYEPLKHYDHIKHTYHMAGTAYKTMTEGEQKTISVIQQDFIGAQTRVLAQLDAKLSSLSASRDAYLVTLMHISDQLSRMD